MGGRVLARECCQANSFAKSPCLWSHLEEAGLMARLWKLIFDATSTCFQVHMLTGSLDRIRYSLAG